MKSKPVVKSKNTVNIPDGIYVGVIGGWNLTIESQDYYGEKIPLEYGIKTISLPVVVIIKNSIAHCYDRRIEI